MYNEKYVLYSNVMFLYNNQIHPLLLYNRDNITLSVSKTVTKNMFNRSYSFTYLLPYLVHDSCLILYLCLYVVSKTRICIFSRFVYSSCVVHVHVHVYST